MSEAMKIARGLSLIVMIVTYALLVHQVNATAQVSVLGAILALVPPLLFTVALAWRVSSKIAGSALLSLSIFAMWLLWPWVMQHTALLFWLQDVGLMLVLLLSFGLTLQAGRKPLCVHFAEIIHGGELSAEHARYARNVTVAWVVFFAAIISISSVLFIWAPLATWSIFVNFLTLPLVGLMFMAEFMVRRRVLVDLPSGHILDAVRAYRNHSARSH
jgi:uncharacterized membrane protein